MSTTSRSTRTTTRKKASSASSTASSKMATTPLKVSKRTITTATGGGSSTADTVTAGGSRTAAMPAPGVNTTTSSSRSSRRRNNNQNDHEHSRLADLSQYSQHNGDRKDEHVAFFVLPEGLTPATCCHSLTSAFTAATEAQIVCKWMTTEECLTHTPAVENVFIMAPFSGPAFDRLVAYKEKNQCYLLGPQILRYLIGEEPSLDFGGAPPIYSVAMRNLLVTLTGVSNLARKEELSRKITRMFGTESKCLTKGVTHVVADHMLTDKVFKAYETNIPVMTTAWIDAVWEDSQNEIVHAVDKKYVKYACPVFHKLLICVSQVSSGLKEALRNAIEANGGQYSPELIKNKTSLLIVPKPEGDKFKYAQQWRLPCVVPEWVEACKSAGSVKHPADYAVDLFNKVPNPPNPAANKKKTNNVVVNSSPLNSMVEPMRVGGRYNESMLSNINGSCARELPTDIHEEEDVLKNAAELLKSYSQNMELFLDGFRIYISKNLKSDDVRKLVSGSGAMRLDAITDRVTHIIAPLDNQLQPAELLQIKEIDPRPHMVNIQWLMESAKQGSPANEDKFRVFIDSKNLTSVTNLVPETSSSQISISALVENGGNGSKANSSKSKSSNNVSTRSSKGSSDAGRGAAASKTGLGSNSTNSTNHSRNQRENGHISNGSRRETHNSSPEEQEIINMFAMDVQNDQGATSLGASNYNQEEGDPEPKLFTGRKFHVVIDIDEDREEVQKDIIEYGGRLSKNNYDILIVSPIYCPDTLVVKSGAILRTKQWVTDCIEFNTTLDGDPQYFHSPLPGFPKMLEICPNVVVAVSQYPNTEKEYLSVLVTAMGGLCQDVFARKSSAPVQRSTHLICSKTDNEKYRAAQKWGIPVVVAEWVVDCFKSQSRLSLDNYDTAMRTADSQSTVNYFPTTPRAPASTTRGAKGTAKVPINKDSVVEAGDGQQPSNGGTPKASGSGGSAPTVFKTPVSRDSRSRRSSTCRKANGSLEEIPMTESFVEYCRTHKTPDMSKDESFQEWLKLQPKTPTPPASELSPIIGSQLGFTREQSRKLKAAFNQPELPQDVGIMVVNRRSSTPIREFMARTVKDLHKLKGSNAPTGVIDNRIGVGGRMEVAEAAGAVGAGSGTGTAETGSTPRAKRSSDSSPEKADSSNHVRGSTRSSQKRRKISSDNESGDTSEAELPEDTGNRRITRRDSSNRQQNMSTTEPSSLSDQEGENPSESIVSSSKPEYEAEADISSTRSSKRLVNETRSSSTSGRESSASPQPQPQTVNDRPTRRMEKLKNLLATVDDQEGSNDRNSSTSKSSKTSTRISKNGNSSRLEEDDKPNDSELDAPAVVWAAEHDSDSPPPVESLPGPSQRPRRNSSLSSNVSNSPVPTKIPVKSDKRRKGGFCIPVPQKATFILSGLNEEDKNSIKSALGTLGAVVTDSPNFDLSAFAIVANTLARSEKILCGIASGKPLVHSSYADACSNAEELLPITDGFLWKEKDDQSDSLKELARAAYSWVKRIREDPNDTPFRGESFFVQSGNKKLAFTRLIQAGGGSVVDYQEEATIILITNPTVKQINGIRVENVTYLSNKILGLQ